MDDYEDLDAVISKAKEYGVEKIVLPSVDANSFDKVMEISNKYEGVYGALGIHPTESQNAKEEDFEKIKSEFQTSYMILQELVGMKLKVYTETQ